MYLIVRLFIRMVERSMDHKQLGIQFFNETWDLIDKKERTPEEDSLMMDKAHASSLHWLLSEAYEPVNGVRSQWQLARVYALLQMGESSLYHAERSLHMCELNGIGDFDLAFAYEAMARAQAICGDIPKADEYIALAKGVSENIAKEDDKKYLLSEINTIK